MYIQTGITIKSLSSFKRFEFRNIVNTNRKEDKNHLIINALGTLFQIRYQFSYLFRTNKKYADTSLVRQLKLMQATGFLYILYVFSTNSNFFNMLCSASLYTEQKTKKKKKETEKKNLYSRCLNNYPKG